MYAYEIKYNPTNLHCQQKNNYFEKTIHSSKINLIGLLILKGKCYGFRKYHQRRIV